MKIIVDASSLILLEKIGLLEHLANKAIITIPKSVEKESVEKGKQKGLPDAYLIAEKIKAGKIHVTGAKNMNMIHTVSKSFNLGEGESEAIALYLEHKEGILATEDRLAINACKALQIPFATSIAFVLQSYDTKNITAKEATHMIQTLADFGRYRNDIIFDALNKIKGETYD